jgi:redox-sensitive bicupin YhaK (pirin superfamily)
VWRNRLICDAYAETSESRQRRDDSPGALMSVVDLAIGPRLRPLGGMQVNRVWPTARRRLIGPFIFFDHMLPVELPPGRGLDVPPHPHIGLATVTYLFAGAITHRDSLGIEQVIRPSELNWMTAGRGIVHSERTPDGERAKQSSIHGIQAWVALPGDVEECEPRFEHYPQDALPVVDSPVGRLRVIAGSAFGVRAPVATASPLFYVEADLASGARLTLSAGLGERGVYALDGDISIAGEPFPARRMLVLRNGGDVDVVVREQTKVMLIGGAPLGGERHIWWNFVSSSAQRIETAKQEWREGRFPGVPGDDEFMPLPE